MADAWSAKFPAAHSKDMGYVAWMLDRDWVNVQACVYTAGITTLSVWLLDFELLNA